MKEMLQNKAIISVGVLFISISLFTNLATSSGNEIISADNSNLEVMENSI